MHPKLCIVLLFSATIGITLTVAVVAADQPKVNIVLEKSCWTSDSCREEFNNRYNGRVSTVQIRVPWELMQPVFNLSIIGDSFHHLQSSDARAIVEPLYVIKNEAEMDQLHRIAHDLTVLNLPRGAFLLDSTDAKENLAVITRELAIIHTVFRRTATTFPGKFYNIPPRSFLTTKHLHKYLSFVRKHVTGIRLQLENDDNNESTDSVTALPLDTLDEMLTVISNSSLVPEVEAKNNNAHLEILQQLSRHHKIVFQTIATVQDMTNNEQQLLHRVARSPPVDSLNFHLDDSQEQGDKLRQGHLSKLFPSLALRTPALPWAQHQHRRFSPNLEKLFDKLGAARITAAKPIINLEAAKTREVMMRNGAAPSTVSAISGGGRVGGRVTNPVDAANGMPEDKIFRNSDNPRFPKEDVTLSMIDHRGDVYAKDYDYVEFSGTGEKKKPATAAKQQVFRDLSEEEDAFAAREQQSKDRIAATKSAAASQIVVTDAPTAAPVKETKELGEMETYPKPKQQQKKSRYDYLSQLYRHHQLQGAAPIDDDEAQYYDQSPIGNYEVAGQPSVHYYAGAVTGEEDEDAAAAGGPYQVLNITAADSYYHHPHHPMERPHYIDSDAAPLATSSLSARQPSKRRRTGRVRRDIFSQLGGGATDGAGVVSSLFQDIRNYYPSMLERLAVIRPRRGDDLVCRAPSSLIDTTKDNQHIERLFDVNEGFAGRKVRSSVFVRHDPAENEIGYKPTPVTLPPIFKVLQTPKPTPPPPMSIMDVFLDSWYALTQQIKEYFS